LHSLWLRLLLCAAVATAAPLKSTLFPLAFESHASTYVAHGAGYSLTIAADGARLQWGGQSLRLQLFGADSHASLQGLERMPGHVTYLLGTSDGDTYNLYGQVLCRAIHPGIDMLYHGNQERLEYDFHVAPRTSADVIALSFPGADRIAIDSHGDLVLYAGGREIRQPRPQAWQMVAGQKRDVAVSYRQLSGGRIGFRIAVHDAALPLVIDPILVFETAFGGSGSGTASALALDARNNIYVAGTTTSSTFSTVHSLQGQLGTAPMLSSTDGGQTWTFETLGTAISIGSVVAAPSSPSTLYANSEQGVFQSSDGGSTWKLAANNGLPLPATDISVDAGSSSALYACGGTGIYVSTDGGNTWTASNTGVATINGNTGAQCYAIRANPAKPGTVFYMAHDPAGFYRSVDFGKTWTALNTGPTETVDSIAFNPASPDDFFVGQVSDPILHTTDGFNTFTSLGAQGVGNSHGLILDPSNASNLYLADGRGVQKSVDGGKTWSIVLSNPNVSVLYNAVLAIDPRNPSRLYAFETRGLFVSSDSGQTWSLATTPYPVMMGTVFVAPADSRILVGTESAGDAFVTKWDPTGTQILYSTYLGGAGSDAATGIAVDNVGSAYVLGYTSSANFPVTSGALQKSLVGSHNAFVSKLSVDGSRLLYSTYFGGGTEFTTAIAVDAAGAAYLAGSVTGTLPVTANAFQKAPGGKCTTSTYPQTGDAFVAKISPDGGALAYASYLGGSCADQATGIAALADGSTWVAGTTFSPDFPVTGNALQSQLNANFGDGFVAHVSAAGALTYATYLGAASYSYSEIGALTLDSAGDIFLTGTTGGFSQSASAGAFQPTVRAGCIFDPGPPPGAYPEDGNAFVMKLNPSGTAITGLTYLGGACLASGTAIAVDSAGAPWIAGSPSVAFPTVSPFQIQMGGGFVSKFSPDLTQLLFSTYFDSVDGLVLDSSGIAYVAGAIQSTITLNPPPSQAYLAKIDPTPAAISLDNVSTASPFQLQTLGGVESIAPGKVVRLEGHGIGPASYTPGIVTSGKIATLVAGVQVTFDGVPAALLYMSATEIECITPFGIVGGGTTKVQVTYNGAKSNVVTMPVSVASPEVLSVLNPDYSVNSPSNPAPAGSIMSLYVTGAGETNPATADGVVNTTPLALPIGAVTVTNQGVGPLPVTFAAAAYGYAPGILQVNFQAPPAPAGLIVTINGSNAYFGVTVQ